MYDVFVHIPKTAGSSLRTVLYHQYAHASFYFEPESNLYAGESPTDLLMRARGTKLVLGHFPVGLHKRVARPCRYFTLLRDPIERSASEYAHISRDPSHPRYSVVSTLSLERYLLDMCTGWDQTKFLVDPEFVSENKASAAMHTLSHVMTAFGLTSRFIESVLIISKYLGWQPPLFACRNRAPNTQHREVIPYLRALVADHFTIDLQTYAFAESEFGAMVAREGTSLGEAAQALTALSAEIESSNESTEGYSDPSVAPIPARLRHKAENSAEFGCILDYLRSPKLEQAP